MLHERDLVLFRTLFSPLLNKKAAEEYTLTSVLEGDTSTLFVVHKSRIPPIELSYPFLFFIFIFLIFLDDVFGIWGEELVIL